MLSLAVVYHIRSFDKGESFMKRFAECYETLCGRCAVASAVANDHILMKQHSRSDGFVANYELQVIRCGKIKDGSFGTFW